MGNAETLPVHCTGAQLKKIKAATFCVISEYFVS
jgi:hypothetical protein